MKKRLLIILSFLYCFALFAQDTAFRKYDQQIPGSSLRFTMVPVASGSFHFGNIANDTLAEADEKPSHKVMIDAFWMGAKEVSYQEYNLFFSDASTSQNIPTDAVTRPSSPYIDLTLGMGKDGAFPANSMQQYGAIMYCKWLYAKTGIFFRLPTEAEWEYACKAGVNSIYPFGNDSDQLKDFAWYNRNSEDRYHESGLKKPNAWGLYDMLGNVAEWVLDQYQADYYSSLHDPVNNPVRLPEKKTPRIVKGGSYVDAARELRASNRIKSDPVWNLRDPQIPRSRWWNADAPFIGFRIIRPLKQPTNAEAEQFFKTYLGF